MIQRVNMKVDFLTLQFCTRIIHNKKETFEHFVNKFVYRMSYIFIQYTMSIIYIFEI
jgi:hypothetical protein